MATKPFKGSNVFLSRNLVPPELFDSLHGALKQNGAGVFLCCDPSRNGLNDYHIISSIDHEKFEYLRSKGCNLIGPQCVLSCAKEHRDLPKLGFTCCLAMDGVRILASGFEMDEKAKIQKLVNSMGGVLQTKATSDISFVIAKNVLAAKYKWAFNILKKPIVTVNWLYQCWTEHRVVPHESYRILPFFGLTICVTRIPADERKEMENIIVQNGGKYSAELTRKCTHLVCDSPEGDKYKVAQRWGHIHVVSRKWFDKSVNRRACLNEDCYPVQVGPICYTGKGCLKTEHSQETGLGNLQPTTSIVRDSNSQAVHLSGIADQDFETTLSQKLSSPILDAPILIKEENSIMPEIPPTSEMNFLGNAAGDSQLEENDLYLSDCRILFVGFEASELRKLVNMVRRGGGSRYMSFNEKLTHIVVGSPSENEKREARALAALGVIHVVRTIWLEDCEHERKEIPVFQRHNAYDMLLPKTAQYIDPVFSDKGSNIGPAPLRELRDGKGFTDQSFILPPGSIGCTDLASGVSIVKNRVGNAEINGKGNCLVEGSTKFSQRSQTLSLNDKFNHQNMIKSDASTWRDQNGKPSAVFSGKRFCFSMSFPEDQRAEIVEWVQQGGGEVLGDDPVTQMAHFIVECHGAGPGFAHSLTISVSSHWIRSCLEDGCLLDIVSHILYSPLRCQIPLPGFGSFRFCVSQYEEKERLLLRNLCFVLGAKFVEKLTRKVTHLLCKFTGGPKYEAACKWGIKSVTSEWIYACIKHNAVVALNPYSPKEATADDGEAGLCLVSQYPTQAARMMSVDDHSLLASQSQNPKNLENKAVASKKNNFEDAVPDSADHHKRARHLKNDRKECVLESAGSEMNTEGIALPEGTSKEPVVPDVASAIEDLLEQTSKIQDLKSPERTACDKNVEISDGSILGPERVDPHSDFLVSKDWLNGTEKKRDVSDRSGHPNASGFDGFSETQTDSQVVGYEEDLSGRQMIIDRVRAQGSMY